MHTQNYLLTSFSEHQAVLEQTQQKLQREFDLLTQIIVSTLQKGNKIFFCGNGGSSADASHLATEFVIRFQKNRQPYAAIALGQEASMLTACSNDFGFVHVFERQLEALAHPGDLLIAISTSGTSPNVIAALKKAQSMRLQTAFFHGALSVDSDSLCDIVLAFPSTTTARIQEAYLFLGHCLCDAVESELD